MFILHYFILSYIMIKVFMGIGDWGLGIAQSPIPNPQSPIYLI